MLAEGKSTGSGNSIIGLNIIPFGAFVIVVVDFRSRFFGMKGRDFHDSHLLLLENG
jgi:hypothetical protein